MDHHSKEHCHANHDAIALNIISKRIVIEDDTSPSPNQASTSDASPHVQVMNAQSNIVIQ